MATDSRRLVPPASDRPSESGPASLIGVAELAAALRGPVRPVLLDVRWSLTDNGYDAFLRGRIPGAVFLDLDRDLAAPPGIGGRHPLPDPAVLAALARRAGIDDDTAVVVVGARDTSIAARAWWLLRWAGYRNVRVLDGGFAAWQAAALPTEVGPESTAAPAAGHRVAAAWTGAGAMPTVDADGAAAIAHEAGSVLLDARAAERYRGDIEPVDPVPGHIPGAVNLPLVAVHDSDGRLLPADELRRIFAEAGVRGDAPAAASCGSGVTACSLILAAEVAGLRLALYPGSYSGWCAAGRPVERG